MASSKLPQWLYKSEFLDIWFGSQLGSQDIDCHPNLKVSKAKLRKFVQVTDIIRNKARNLNSFLLFCALFLNQVHRSGIVIVKQTNKQTKNNVFTTNEKYLKNPFTCLLDRQSYFSPPSALRKDSLSVQNPYSPHSSGTTLHQLMPLS